MIIPNIGMVFGGYSFIVNGLNPFSVVLLISSLILIILLTLFFQGYMVQFLRSRSSGGEMAPDVIPGSISDLNVMLKEGFSFTLIVIIYTIIPLVLFSLIFLSIYPISMFIEYGMALTYAGDSEIASLTEGMLPAIFSLIGISILLAAYSYYVIPAPILVYANNRNFAMAFSLNKITNLLFNRAYIIGFLYVLLAILLITIISIVVALIPLIGWLISIPISIMGGLTVWSIWGQVYREIFSPLGS